LKKRIAIVTIGQSPRTDVVPEMQTYLGSHVSIVERGALDGLSADEIRAFGPAEGMLPLVTRLANGTEVIVAKEKLLPRLAEVIKKLDREGMDFILLLCNGDFPDFDTRCLIVEPQRIVDRSLAALMRPHRRLGVLVPVADQEAWVRERLEPVHSRLTVATASPYKSEASLEQACEQFRAAKCDLVVLYCMGFNRKFGDRVRAICNRPVIVSNTLVARFLGELAA